MKTVIEMAREAGLRSAVLLHMYGKESALCDSEIEELRQLERFAELVRADEREKYKWDVHSCGPSCTNVACMAVREAVKTERAACAELVFNSPPSDEYESPLMGVYKAIRARGSNT